ncbi:stress-induced protein KIN1-like [Corylus avellana]|uniref:stress-induced protein KIN1-like n=1 Tax=Corylus avellana TaxID=13451 RepID=UPI001E2169B3|nr:stress-induced protein KIN1-like [Corylus avellana]
MDQSQNASYQAGQTKGQAEEKASGMMDKAGNAAQGAKQSCQESGEQMKSKAQGAVDAVKSTLGANK